MAETSSLLVRRRPPRRRADARVAARPFVVLWFVCTRRHWAACERRGLLCAQPSLAKKGLRPMAVALHGDVGGLALSIAGACRADLLALALHPRAFADAGVNTRVRVDLDAHGRARIDVGSDLIPLGDDARRLVVAVEPLRPLPDEAGYDEPRYVTDGDVERATSRGSFRRTR